MGLVHRCMIIHAALQAQCQAIPEASRMWTTGLSLDGAAPATNYISSGLVDQAFADMLVDPEALAAATGITLTKAKDIVSGMSISEEDPYSAMKRLGLMMVIESEYV